MKRNKLKPVDAPLSWGYAWKDGKLINVADCQRPRKLGRNTYTSAMQAVGARVVRVRIIRDRDYKRLLRAAVNGSPPHGD